MQTVTNGHMEISRVDETLAEAVSEWSSGVLAAALRAPATDPDGWAVAAARGVAATVPGGRAVLWIESNRPDLAARGVSFVDDDFKAHQWLHDLRHGVESGRRVTQLGLHGLDVAAADVHFPDSRGVLTLEIAGDSPGWRSPEAVSFGLVTAARQLARVYERHVVETVMRRRRLMDRLRPTQQALVPMLVEGLAESQIAERIGRSKHTVHDHTKKIYRALGIHTRLDLAALWNGYEASAAPTGGGPRRHAG